MNGRATRRWALAFALAAAAAGGQTPAAPAARDRGDILLESGRITRADREARQRRVAGGRLAALATDVDETLAQLGQRRADRAWYIVRAAGPRVAGVKAALEAAGAQVHGYVQHYAFLARMDAAALERVAALPDVEHVGVYRPEHRLASRLQQTLEARRQDAAAAADIEVEVYLFTSEEIDDALQMITGAGGQVSATVRKAAMPKLRARLPWRQVERLSRLPAVRMIHERVPEQPLNDRAAAVMGVPPVWNTHGLTGTNQIVGHADTGLDTGTTGPGLNADFAGRIVAAYALGRTGDWSDPHGHGTHTAGSILGNGTNSLGQYRGIAPGARLVHQSVMAADGSLGGLPADFGDLFEQAYTNGARIHSDSWGAANNSAYGRSLELDTWMWNGGTPRDMLICVAAGNEGNYAGTICTPGTAKNCLTVGASENNRSECGWAADNTNEIAYFSSWGPTDEGRMKPDIVAPGTWIASVRTHGDTFRYADNMNNGTGTWSECRWTNNTFTANETPWTWVTNAPGHSASSSWHYAQNGKCDDALLGPTLTAPSGHGPTVVRLWWRGQLGDANSRICAAYMIGGTWKHTTLKAGPASQAEWWMVEAELQLFGVNTPFLIEVWGSSDSSSINVDIDDFRVGTFGNWAELSDFNLAPRGQGADTNYTLMGGTSMATPLAAGAAALVRQHYQQRLQWSPSAALMKGTLIDGAVNLATQRPWNTYGWGRLNLERALFPAAPRQRLFLDRTAGLSEGQTDTWHIPVLTSNEQLRVALVWTDREGATLQNDLDMRLTAPNASQIWRTNAIDNVEGIDVAAPQVGTWTLDVWGETVPYGPQPYALVVSGGITDAPPFHLWLHDETVTGVRTNDARSSIHAGPAFESRRPANLLLRAGETIRLEPGFRAATGGVFRAVIEPSLR